jgi:hypothetical protein
MAILAGVILVASFKCSFAVLDDSFGLSSDRCAEKD